MPLPRAARARLVWALELSLGLELYACAVLALHARGLRATPLEASAALVLPALVIPPVFYVLVALVSVREGSLPNGEPELRFATGPGIRHLIAGTLTPAQAVKEDVVTILKGNLKLLQRFTELFRIDGRQSERAGRMSDDRLDRLSVFRD